MLYQHPVYEKCLVLAERLTPLPPEPTVEDSREAWQQGFLEDPDDTLPLALDKLIELLGR